MIIKAKKIIKAISHIRKTREDVGDFGAGLVQESPGDLDEVGFVVQLLAVLLDAGEDGGDVVSHGFE